LKPEFFSSNPNGRLVPTRIHLVPYLAFVPDPLPPEILFDRELVYLIAKSQAAISELSGIARNLQNPTLMVQPFIHREAVFSSKIEGTHTEINDLYAYEAKKKTKGSTDTRSSNDHREVANYVKALDFGLEEIKHKPVDLDLICQLHEILLKDVRGSGTRLGCFRETQGYIGPSDSPDDAIFFPPPVSEMRHALGDFEKYILAGNQYPELLKIAIIHYQFETIHPFEDGNGRIGRLINTLLMVQWKQLPSPLLYLSAFFEKHREKYYQHLLEVSQKGAWRDWIIFFLTGIIEQSQDAQIRAKQLIELREQWIKILAKVGASTRVVQIIDYLFISPSVSVSMIEKFLGVTNRTARKYVEFLTKIRILELSEPKDYAKEYIAREILNIIGSKNMVKID
jgi:Fic family protein